MSLFLVWVVVLSIMVGVSLLDSIIGLVLSSLFFSLIRAFLLRFYASPFLRYIIILIYRGSVLVIFRYFVCLITRLSRNYRKAGIISLFCIPFFLSLPWGEASFSVSNNIFCLFDERSSWIIIFLGFILLFTLLGVVKIVGWSLGALRGFF